VKVLALHNGGRALGLDNGLKSQIDTCVQDATASTRYRSMLPERVTQRVSRLEGADRQAGIDRAHQHGLLQPAIDRPAAQVSWKLRLQKGGCAVRRPLASEFWVGWINTDRYLSPFSEVRELKNSS